MVSTCYDCLCLSQFYVWPLSTWLLLCLTLFFFLFAMLNFLVNDKSSGDERQEGDSVSSPPCLRKRRARPEVILLVFRLNCCFRIRRLLLFALWLLCVSSFYWSSPSWFFNFLCVQCSSACVGECWSCRATCLVGGGECFSDCRRDFWSSEESRGRNIVSSSLSLSLSLPLVTITACFPFL